MAESKSKIVSTKPKIQSKDKKKSVVKPASKGSSLTVSVYGIDGKASGKLELPKEIFGAKVSRALMAQAVRIYLANQRRGTASTKTRGEVEGSSRKIYRQKGTGRARHGSLRAPIFVKGGIVFGPKPRDFGLEFPKKMKRAAVISALSSKASAGQLSVIAGLEKIEPKTSNMASLVDKLSEGKNTKTLLVTSGSPTEGLENVFRAGRNIKDLEILSANLVNTYELLNSKQIIFMKQAIEVLSKNLGKGTK